MDTLGYVASSVYSCRSDAPTFPAASIWRHSIVFTPSPETDASYVVELSVLQLPLPTLHSTVPPGSAAVIQNIGVVALDGPAGPPIDGASGADASTTNGMDHAIPHCPAMLWP